MPDLALLPGRRPLARIGDNPESNGTLEDDPTGGLAEQTVRFTFDGTDYEIDLNAKNAAAFSKQLAPYLEHARRAGRARRLRLCWTRQPL